MAVLVGLLASVAYGAADFLGGLMSRRNSVFTVLLWAQIIGLAWVLAALRLLAEGPFTVQIGLLGAGAGVAGVSGAALLFRGLARGRMSVVAPVTAVLSAALPLLLGLARGERPSLVSLAGVVVALVAIALVSMVPEPGVEDPGRFRDRVVAEGLPEGLGAGVCFAAFFILLDAVPDDAGLWPILAVRLASIVIAAGVVIGRRIPMRPAAGTTLGVLGGGLIGTVADYLYLLGTTLGLLSVVVVLTSLYPVTTVILARTVLGERLGGSQLAGLLLAGVGVVMITAG